MNLDTVNTFLQSEGTCVLATVSEDGQPMAATVGFSHGSDFSFVVATNESTRKYQNLKRDSKIALVVGVVAPRTVQYEGIAKEVTAEELGDRLEKHFEKVPNAKRFAGDSGQRYFLITPTWLRFTDFSASEPIFETRQFS